ncbi:MAG: hypothetical protein ACREUT_20960 [Steroidobacteraceae bacterium]
MSALRQQVNLYQPSGAERAGELAPFAAATAGLLAAAVCAGLLGVWGYGVWRVEHLGRAIETLRREQQQQSATIAALGAARAAAVSPEQLNARLKSLSAVLDMHARALELLRQGAAGQVTGFSARLAALARRPVEGLWLNHLVLSGLNGAMSVDGSALDPELVPRYLEGLAAERALAGVRFDDFVIAREAPKPLAERPNAGSQPSRHFNFRVESESLRTAAADQRL